MKPKIAIVILVLISLGLCVALIARHNKAVREKADADSQITSLSNVVVSTSTKLEDQRQVNIELDRIKQAREAELFSTSNNLTKTSANLEKTVAEAKAAEIAAKAELEKRDLKIAELETQRDDLTKKML